MPADRQCHINHCFIGCASGGAEHQELRMVSFMMGINGAAMLNVLIPHCSSLGMCSSRPASSPHRERGISGTSSCVIRNSLNMASAASLKYCSTAAFSRSAANAYWVRSFVPKLRKSTCLAISRAERAAAGVSIMAPSLGREDNCSSEPSCVRFSFTTATSSGSVTMGTRTRTSNSLVSSSTARKCVFRSSGYSRSKRMPRRPSEGFVSAKNLRKGKGLSAPISRRRTHTVRPLAACSVCHIYLRSSSMLGGTTRPR